MMLKCLRLATNTLVFLIRLLHLQWLPLGFNLCLAPFHWLFKAMRVYVAMIDCFFRLLQTGTSPEFLVTTADICSRFHFILRLVSGLSFFFHFDEELRALFSGPNRLLNDELDQFSVLAI